MASQNLPVKNAAGGFTFYVALRDMAGNGSFKASPTLATGDAKVSIDGAALADLGTLPDVDPNSSIWVKVVLSQSEINGDNINVQFIDQTATKEWCDLAVNLRTVARQLDDLAYPTTSGRSIDVDAQGGVEVDTTQAAAITVDGVASVPRGTVGAASTTTSVVSSAMSPAGAAADQFKGRTMIFDPTTASTTLRGCARTITASSNAATPTFTVDALPAAPASGDTFGIY